MNASAVRLLLASASPARLATLRSAGIEPDVAVSAVDEPAVLAAAQQEVREAGEEPLSAADQVLVLARAKAEDVLTRQVLTPEPAGLRLRHRPRPDFVLGCDSMLEIDGPQGVMVVGKPEDATAAITRWQAMRGRSGVLHSGHYLVRTDDGEARGATSSTTVHFADLSDAEIEAYVATGEPLRVAGAFTIDGLGGPFVRGLEGDHHGVVGVSLPLLREMLGELGTSLTELWSPAHRGASSHRRDL